jgi:hypothetical protein
MYFTAYERAKDMKRNYDKKWDEDEEAEQMLQNVLSSESNVAPIIEQPVAEPEPIIEEKEPLELDPIQQARIVQERLNNLLIWIHGVEILETVTLPNKMYFKLRLTTYLLNGSKEYTWVTVWLEPKISAPLSATKRGRTEAPASKSWRISVIKVQGERTYTEGVDGNRFDDILEYTVETNDIEFLLREIHARIQSEIL